MPIPLFLWIIGGIVVVAGSVAVGAAAADDSEEVKKLKKKAAEATARDEELKKKAAEVTARAEETAAKMKKAGAKFREYGIFDEFVIALVAVGFGVAYSDGEIVEAEEREIEEFLLGVTRSALPEQIKAQIKGIRERPPTFNDAMGYIGKIQDHSAFDPDVIDDIILITMKADGKIHPKEVAFYRVWQDYRKAHGWRNVEISTVHSRELIIGH